VLNPDQNLLHLGTRFKTTFMMSVSSFCVWRKKVGDSGILCNYSHFLFGNVRMSPYCQST